MFVVFEGIDGSGKTTISNRVAQALRDRGLEVLHVREAGRFSSGVTEAIRSLCRDSRNLTISPWTELLLYVAREVQVLDETVAPKLGGADVVIADRFLYTAEVLARHGRGLPEDALRPILESVAGGVRQGMQPDLVVLFDVDPSVARGRRKISKTISPDRRQPSRKGLAGSGLQQRLRQGYLELAARDPDRWMAIDNSDGDLDTVTNRVVALVMAAYQRGAHAAIAEMRRAEMPAIVAQPPRLLITPKQALAAFLDWIDHRALTEPQMAAYVLAGLCGDGIDERRLGLASSAPKVLARGLRGMSDAVSWQLRRQLAAAAPQEVAFSLEEDAAEADEAWQLRRELQSAAPEEVAISLQGLDDDAAWALREQLGPLVPDAVMISLALLDSPRAWLMRERWLAERGGLDGGGLTGGERSRAACRGVTGLDGERAWQIRQVACAAAPVAALVSLCGTGSARSWAWRERYLEFAPKAVLSTIAGLDDPRAWAMRQATAPRCREALDSMIGLDHPIAWDIRESCIDVWPSSVVKSLGVLVSGARGYEILARALVGHADSISVLKHAAAIASGGQLNTHVMAA